MEWRPFALAFVPNTFKEYVSHHEVRVQPERMNIVNGLPVFRYKPSAKDIEKEEEKYTRLRHKVFLQRKERKHQQSKQQHNISQMRTAAATPHLRTLSTQSTAEHDSGDAGSLFLASGCTRNSSDLPPLSKPTHRNGGNATFHFHRHTRHLSHSARP